MCFKRLFLIIFATFFFLFLPKQQSLNYIMAASDPGAYVMEITENAINTLTDASIDPKKKETKFGELFDKNFDIPSISRFVLGK